MTTSSPVPVPRSVPANLSQVASELHLTSFSRLLFMAFAIYLVIPLVDVPLLGLSLSAVFIVLVAMEVFLRHRVRWRRFRFWIITSYFLWFGLVLSVVGNAIEGTLGVGTTEIILVARATFWIGIFVTTMIVIAQIPLSDVRQMLILVGISAMVLGGLRLFEGLAFDRWGGGGTAQIMSQNNYGIQFSRFAPFALMLPLMVKGVGRNFATMGMITLLLAVAANGSRSSWIAVSVGMVAFTMMYLLATPRRTGILLKVVIAALILLTITVSFIPLEILEPVSSRFATFERIEEDKSYAIRELMVQKSLRLFEENPIFGVGLGQFREVSADLDIPQLLSGSMRNFNQMASHNSYAQHLSSTGILGTLPLVVLNASLLIVGYQSQHRLARRGHVWAIAIWVSFVSQAVHLWTVDNLNNTAPWFVYGLVAGMILYEHRTRNETGIVGTS